jgi:RNA polymerase sigma-70 factor (sigma-E family)
MMTDELQAQAAAPFQAAPPDHDSLASLYARHMPNLVRFARLVVGEGHADDVAQDAFLNAASRHRRVRDPRAFDAYLRRAVVNGERQRQRSEARRQARQQRGAPDPVGAVDDLLTVERRLDLARAMDRLSTRQRAVVVLRYWEDMTDQQIADCLNWPIGTVKSTMARALTALREGTRA